MTELVSGRRLAAILGVSPTAVRNAIRDGRITAGPGGKLNPETARREWTAATDPSRSRVRSDGNLRKSSARPEQGARQQADPPPPSAFHLARTDKEAWTARLRQLEYERLAGRLVDREAAERAAFELGRMARDAWMNWPARIAAIAAEEIQIDRATGKADARSVAIVLDRLVREHCFELGEPATLDLRKAK